MSLLKWWNADISPEQTPGCDRYGLTVHVAPRLGNGWYWTIKSGTDVMAYSGINSVFATYVDAYVDGRREMMKRYP